ncbi:MAG: MFS transporter [Phycisphaerales bacterium]|nr:MFS transporter [Phycisphaerales bacterium]
MRSFSKRFPYTFITIGASFGSIIEWYDFFIFISLTPIIASTFFSKNNANPYLAILSTLVVFSVGFLARPLGAFFLGSIGDRHGRKNAFFATLLIMGVSTVLTGCLPSYSTIGIVAPILLLVLRVLQGFALGGEFSSASVFIAEHVPESKKATYLASLQMSSSCGLLLSVGTTALLKFTLSDQQFGSWGWRMPFLLSSILMLVAFLIRRKLQETPMFLDVKEKGIDAKNPVKTTFFKKKNLKNLILLILGLGVSLALISWTGSIYVLIFLQNTMHIGLLQSDSLLLFAEIFAIPFTFLFAYLYDKFPSKWWLLMPVLLFCILLQPVFSNIVKVIEKDRAQFTLSHQNDMSKDWGSSNNTAKEHSDSKVVSPPIAYQLSRIAYLQVLGLYFVLCFLLVWINSFANVFIMVFFETNIRNTATSIAYTIGPSIFGGTLPAIMLALGHYAELKNKAAVQVGLPILYKHPELYGLWYPVIASFISFIIGAIYMQRTKKLA